MTDTLYKTFPICGIYMIINNLNGKQYIGQSRNIVRRYLQHLQPRSKGTPEFHKEIQQMGKDNFVCIILEECSEEKLNEREEYYIRFFEPEYNKSLGQGQKGIIASEETRKKLSKSAKKRWNNYDPETKIKVLNTLNSNHKVGYHLSEETKDKIRQKQLGHKRSEESRKKQSETMKRRYQNSLKVSVEPLYKPIICTTTGESFPSLKAAATQYGLYSADITAVLKGRQKTTHGLHFIYGGKE